MSQLISAIYGLRKATGLDDDTARDLYERTVGKRSLKLMSGNEQARVLQELKQLPQSAPRARLTGPYASKIVALWLDGWNLGVFRDRRDETLLVFVKRQAKVDHTRFLIEAKSAQSVIEALKDWIARDAGVVWGQHADLMDDVIAAQVGKLDLAARDSAGGSGPLFEAFNAWRRDELDRAGKIAVMKLFGEFIRAARERH